MADRGVFVGIDVGSTTVKVVVLDAARRLLGCRYRRSSGRPRDALVAAFGELREELDLSTIRGVGLSGSGGGPIAELIGGLHVNELIAQTRAVGEFHPEARTVIEIGGQDSKFLSVQWEEKSGQTILRDFSMNALCAAGTGAFLDQQAERLGIPIDGDFARVALESTTPARIAGRCTVFAKSDMIHLQQVGTPLSDILAGVCLALARNFTTVIGKGRRFESPILFQGGVACNAAVKRAFESVLGLPPGSIIVPRHHLLMAALGTAYVAMDDAERGGNARAFRGIEPLAEAILAGPHERTSLPVLQPPPESRAAHRNTSSRASGDQPIDAWLGVDVGSVSTNVVVLDDAGAVLARRYLMTAGRPLEAVREGLRQVGGELGSHVRVRGVGATGSGRYLTGDFIGADIVRNEITAQARAAVSIDPDVDAVIEIGGQDSKFIRLRNGAVTDFAMNNACAAGTGSFLQEQADRLTIRIEEEFSDLAFSSGCPSGLGERCTVFMESDLVHHQQQGAKVPDLTAGLAYSIAENYLNRVVNGRPLGQRVLFQGGVAANASVVAALSTTTRRQITVPPHHDVTGAIGVAILAREEMTRRNGNGATRFRGFDLSNRRYESTVFECRACPNLCEVHKVAIESETPFFYGARCDRFEEAGRGASTAWRGIPDLFAERERLLLGAWTDPGPRPAAADRPRPRVGMLRNLAFFDFFPFWRAWLDALGCDVVLSSATNPELVRRTQETAVSETCFPVKLAFGHMLDVSARDVDVVLMPAILNREQPAPGQEHNHHCPFVFGVPQLMAANMPAGASAPRVLHPVLHFENARAARIELRTLAKALTGTSTGSDRAAAAGWAAQRAFYSAVRSRGRDALAALQPGASAVVVVGRPYTMNDPGASLDLPYKLRRLGVLPVPMDFLPLEGAELAAVHDNMYWRSGQEILRAAEVIRDDPRLQAIYLTNFSCGPDAFLLSFFQEALAGKPFLELEVDEHSADAGMITRCEAFFDSLNLQRVS